MPETERHAGALRAAITGTMEALRGGGSDRALDDSVRLDGLTVLVTGASRGLGHAIAGQLGERGATLVLPCRSRHEETAASLKARIGHDRIHVYPVDLADLSTVDALVDTLEVDGHSLDRVVLNAGVVPSASRTTADGLDLMVQVNFLANVRLVDRLLEAGLIASEPDPPRIVVVGSEAHRSAPDLALDTLGHLGDYGTGKVLRWYGYSKLHTHTWAVGLGRRLEGKVAVHHLCPGAIDSEIAREAPAWSKPLLGLLMRATFQSPETAARPGVWLAAHPDAREGTTYLHMRAAKDPDPRVLDPALGAGLWDAAHDLLDRLRP